MDAFIDDGYTETVGIEAVDGLHPGMEFTRRPFAGEEGTEVFRRIQMGPTQLKLGAKRPTAKQAATIEKEQQPQAVKERLLEVILERVSSWNFDRPLEAESLNKLRSQLFTKLHNVVFGYEAPDYIQSGQGERLAALEDQAEEDAKN